MAPMRYFLETALAVRAGRVDRLRATTELCVVSGAAREAKAVYLASDYGACTTGEIIMVDSGFHVLGMPQSENL